MLCLLGNKEAYISMANGMYEELATGEWVWSRDKEIHPQVFLFHLAETRLHQHTPRLFEMSSTIGEFVGNEVVFPARSGEVESFTFDQNDLYSVNQPGKQTTVSSQNYVCTPSSPPSPPSPLSPPSLAPPGDPSYIPGGRFHRGVRVVGLVATAKQPAPQRSQRHYRQLLLKLAQRQETGHGNHPALHQG